MRTKRSFAVYVICPVLIFTILTLQACFPLKPFNYTRTPAPPDYSKTRYWSALPFKKDSADAIVRNSGLKDGQATARADVFFIHPTTYPRGMLWNADLKDTAVNHKTDRLSSRYQASVFNGSCKVYVPRYRAAVLFAYVSDKIDARKAFELAYSDIKCAFEYYMKHYNHGRPIIIASHSQGSDYAIRLLKEYFDNDTLMQKKLVAAYIVGGLVHEDTFKNLRPCDTSCQAGCFVTWNTVRWGELTFYGKPISKIICINPLTWKQNSEYAPDSLNKGGVDFGFNKIDLHVADAKCSPIGLLWVHRPKGRTKKEYPQINSPWYHLLDYNLFYMNIRENVKERINHYFAEKKMKIS